MNKTRGRLASTEAMKGQTSKGLTFDYTLANSMPTYPTSALNGRHLAN